MHPALSTLHILLYTLLTESVARGELSNRANSTVNTVEERSPRSCHACDPSPRLRTHLPVTLTVHRFTRELKPHLASSPQKNFLRLASLAEHYCSQSTIGAGQPTTTGRPLRWGGSPQDGSPQDGGGLLVLARVCRVEAGPAGARGDRPARKGPRRAAPMERAGLGNRTIRFERRTT